MPLAFLLDENLRGPVWVAVVDHNAKGGLFLDVTRVGDPADLPLGSKDPTILLWAEREERILVSVDENTLPSHFANHLLSGYHSPGLFLVKDASKFPQIVAWLELVAYASDPHEWRDRVEWMP